MRKGLLIILIILSLFGCGSREPQRVEREKFLFGTYIKIIVYDEDTKLAEKAIEAAFREIARIDAKMNNHSEGSLIDKINKSTEKRVEIDEEGERILGEVKRVYKLSKGGFDITLRPLLETWGFTVDGGERVPTPEEIEEALSKVDYSKVKIEGGYLTFDAPVEKIDTGAFLKGYAIAQAKLLMEDMGIKSAFITSISSIETIGTKPGGVKWRIGIQNPSNPREILKVANLDDKAMGVSGDYQTFVEIDGKKYHHILSTKDGYPIRDKKMVVVICEDGYTADLYSTAFFSMKIEDIMNYVETQNDLEVLIVDENSKIVISSGFSAFLDK
ncbi:FAD:protein FMN transferase [Propionigenium maris DSM 9537]|uniref:FAD:protein FMN transferase n=1 Tax=Propionigenium maris DSM 9537 TaxID=1123000 RepID=A0A9W6GMK3_9FUSO|nr:FAD:protein FMN transferase [Propionigenium maris]GLI57848.1 FAD:protein FMN transferase [Propionigenium maris DSM 9537]